jgi:hypothetical protein
VALWGRVWLHEVYLQNITTLEIEVKKLTQQGTKADKNSLFTCSLHSGSLSGQRHFAFRCKVFNILQVTETGLLSFYLFAITVEGGPRK